MKLLRLRGRKVCDRLIRQGKVWKGKHMTIRWMEGYPRHPAAKAEVSGAYVGTLTSAKLDKSAVNRNRMRRRCRESLRLFLQEHGASFSGSLQLLIAPRSSSLKAPFLEIHEDIRMFFTTRPHGRR